MAESQYKTTESAEQTALIRWAKCAENQYPELELLYHVPNEGKRSPRMGARLRDEGLRSGVPDLVLPVGRGGYLGLYIEMKVGRNTPTVNQECWLRKLTQQGYFTAVCYGWEEAKSTLEHYLSKEATLKIIEEWRTSREI